MGLRRSGYFARTMLGWTRRSGGHGKHGPIALRAVTDGLIGRIGIAVPYMIPWGCW